MVKHSKTLVEWAWWNDHNWISYDKKTNLFLENEYQSGNKEIKADDQRFVDVDFKSPAAVRKDVHSKDENLIGVQRRYDDRSRRRAVRRVVPQPLEKETFLIVGDARNEEEMIDNIELYGGLIVKKFSKKVTKVIALKNESSATALKSFKQAKKSGKLVLNTNYIEALLFDKKVKEKDFEIDFDDNDDNSHTSSTSTTTTTKSTKSTTKRKVSETSSPSKVVSKKKKIDSSASLSKNHQLLLTIGATFEGKVRYSDDDQYPFMLTIESQRALGDVTAVARWKTIADAETEWRIQIDPSGMFSATEAGTRNMQAIDHIAIGSKYSGHMSSNGDILMGKVEESQASGAALSPTFNMVAIKGLGKITAPISSSVASTTDMKVDSSPVKRKGVLTLRIPVEIEELSDDEANITFELSKPIQNKVKLTKNSDGQLKFEKLSGPVAKYSISNSFESKSIENEKIVDSIQTDLWIEK